MRPQLFRNKPTLEAAIVTTFILVGLLTYCKAWWAQMDLSFNWEKSFVGAKIFGDDCDYATGVTDDSDFSRLLSVKHDYEKILVPFRRAPAKPVVNDRGYIIVRCRVDLTKEATGDQSRGGWLSLGPIYGDSAIYLNGSPKLRQIDGGYADIQLLPEDLGTMSEVIMISKKDIDHDVIGPTTLVPLFFTNDRLVKLRADHAANWFNRVQKPSFLAAYELALFIFFACAWIMGLRYSDVGWMVVLSATISLKDYLRYFITPTWEPWRLLASSITRYALLFAIATFLLAFLRRSLKKWTPARLFLGAVTTIVVIRLCLPRYYWDLLRLEYAAIPLLTSIFFVAAAVLGLSELKHLNGRRRSQVLLVSVTLLLVSPFYILQMFTDSSAAFAVEPFIPCLLMTMFSCFIAADVVSFYKLYLNEKSLRLKGEDERAGLEQRLGLGEAVQNLLLPKTMTGKSGNFRYSFFYEPFQGMSGDWIATWTDGERTHVLLGDVIGKGPQAALAVTAILAAVNEAKAVGDNLKQGIYRINRMLRDLFDGHILTTLTAATLESGGHVELLTCGSVGWYMSQAGDVKRLGSSGSILGASAQPEIDEQKFVMPPGALLFTFTDGVIDGARSTASFMKKLRDTVIGPEQHYELFQLAQEAAKGKVVDDDKGMIAISAL